VAAILCVVVMLSVPGSVTAQSGIQGAWRVVEVTTIGPSPSTNSQPQPGLYLFTTKHYSFVRVTAAQPRAALQDAAKATAAELLAVWGNAAFIANSGTYEVSGDTLTTRPLVAKNPQIMQADTVVTFTMKRDGDTLMLRSGTSSLGPIGNPVAVRLVRVE
jgi:hypothetical protein